VTHDTAGSLPAFAAAKKEEVDCTLPSWWSSCTSVKVGSGFQMPGVLELWAFGGQVAASSSQSGCVPVST